MEVHFFSLASGSSGNCYYIGNHDYGFLIDAGIGPRTIVKRLKEKNVSMNQIMAIFITHDHTDHVKYAGCLSKKFHIPIYCTKKIKEVMSHCRNDVERFDGCERIIEKESLLCIRDFTFTAFETPHDGSDNVGYFVDWKEDNLALATDLGHISKIVDSYLSRTNHLVIEANYDQNLLDSGSYPDFLKQRIVHDRGHLCNDATAEYLSASIRPSLKHIFLCHLSQENNAPDIACRVVERALQSSGLTPVLTVLPRKEASATFVF